jgi:hypothetical protein
MKYKTGFLLLTLCLLILITFLKTTIIDKPDYINTFSINATTKEEITEELIIALFMDHIEAAAHSFYDDYFTKDGLMYYNYEQKILDISKSNHTIHITFGITPMIGAHNPVGYDEATFSVDVFGNITLDSFKHLKSFEIPLPWRFKGQILKPLPVTK